MLFDIGSTLVNSRGRSPSALIAGFLNDPGITSADIGNIIMQEDLQTPDEVYVRLGDVFGDVDPCVRQEIAGLWATQSASLERLSAAKGVLRCFKDAGCKIGVVSNIWRPYYEAFKDACPELLELIDYQALSFKEGYKKPAPEIFLRTLDALNSTPQATLMIGDTYDNDIGPAIALGMKTVWVLSRIEHERQALIGVLNGQRPRPLYCIEDISDFV
ncbi:HAD-superfamily hydrolase, subfamily IA, variant 1 [Candidatus Magnetobacterium bavaricum]|uniref:HAD-superfamily hydrolase, subfamily IA, variant 1 n=1 Tax=Candidatus Magnetobacterium bavaricum TaxID=29290 RepID=A0A0F3GK33_9BACT|nr:HAD-superfamily hydrolase, subfamily IA, variant 1 [Candidatus Magnetobacterium bavaricum]